MKEGHVGDDNAAHHLLQGWKPPHIDHPEDDFVPEVEHEGGSFRAKAELGSYEGGRVYWDPDLDDHRLSNEHVSITGESGSGKTQVLKSMMAQLTEHGIRALVLDFKDDYAEPAYASKEGFVVYDPTKQAIPMNPLAPPADPISGEVNPTFHSYQLSEILGRIYRLGDLQSYNLRRAIHGVYNDAGVSSKAHTPAAGAMFPSFQKVQDKLAEDKNNADLLGHMSPMFDFGFFSDENPEGFGKLVDNNVVIRLGQLPGNEVKNSVAEFFLMALYNHLIRQEQTHNLRSILVLDEAWRLVRSPFLEPLMREGRAFGLGVFVATQFPSDLPLTVSGSTATQIFLSQSAPSEIAEVQRIAEGTTRGPEAEALGDLVRSLPPLSAVMHNKQYMPYVRVECTPYFKRNVKEAGIRDYFLKKVVGPNGLALRDALDQERVSMEEVGHNDWRAECHEPGCGWASRFWKDMNDTSKMPTHLRDMADGVAEHLKAHSIPARPDVTAATNPHTPESGQARADGWSEHLPMPAGSEEGYGRKFFDGPREYNDQVDGKYICQCGFSTDNEPTEEDNWQPICNYCKGVGHLNGMQYGDQEDPGHAHSGDESLMESYKNWWEKKVAQAYPKCPSCGEFGINYADGKYTCNRCGQSSPWDYLMEKKAELVAFPPGTGEEETWFLPYDIVNERFVESPRKNRTNQR